MSDIVERLRSVSGCTQKTFLHRLDWEDGKKIINEAAAEIDRLQSRIRELERALEFYAEPKNYSDDYWKGIWKTARAALSSREVRQTFVIPAGHEAIRDADGRATGETCPMKD